MKIIYLAGKYRDVSPEAVDANIALAESYAIDLWNRGYGVISPHLNTKGFERLAAVPEDKYLEFYLQVLEFCDAMFVLPNYYQSTGTLAEITRATDKGIPIFSNLRNLEIAIDPNGE